MCYAHAHLCQGLAPVPPLAPWTQFGATGVVRLSVMDEVATTRILPVLFAVATSALLTSVSLINAGNSAEIHPSGSDTLSGQARQHAGLAPLHGEVLPECLLDSYASMAFQRFRASQEWRPC